jgi:thiamine kinase-like enzyme
MPAGQTPIRSSSVQRRPADTEALWGLVDEFGLQPVGRKVSFELISDWAGKHVWRMDVDDTPWAYIRYLLGPAKQYPQQWRHLRLSVELYQASVGPTVLGITESSRALSDRAAIIEEALLPLTREEVESRPEEAVTVMAHLHSCQALYSQLLEDLTENDRHSFSPLTHLFNETRERWFEAVYARWMEADMEAEIELATRISATLLEELEALAAQSEEVLLIVPAHNDPNHGNFMTNQDGILRMIDFEEMSLNNPVADLGIFLVWYVDSARHRDILESAYPLIPADTILERMKIWVPLRYINLSAHWASRMIRARDEENWDFARTSTEDWLRSASELIYNGEIRPDILSDLRELQSRLNERIFQPRD